jgi:UDP-glucose 4-epimerase
MEVVLVTGGAGYVGSVVAEELVRQGYRVVVFDNLQQGHRQAVVVGTEFVQGDVCNVADVEAVFQKFPIDAVIHMAAETVVEYSISDPARYFRTNVVGGVNLLDVMLKYGVFKIVFSSSAAVYGEPESVPIEESHRTVPVNAYGESKLLFERILAWYGCAYGLKHISFRYFNAAGATELLGEDHRPETHLIPNILKVALHRNGTVSIFGTDYPTKDGTCVRDYVHVVDIAQAHVLALKKMGSLRGSVYNLGSGTGFTVLEVVRAAEEVVGEKIPVKLCPRRAGDPAVLVASWQRARGGLGWKPQFFELTKIVEDAWRWLKDHPYGYE